MNRQRGFTLVETLVALAILTIALTVLFSSISGALDRVRRGRDEAVANALVQSLLARAEATNPVPAGESTGVYSNGFRWRLRVHAFGSAEDAKAWTMGAYTIRADVSWPQGQRTLTTLRLVPSPPKSP